MTLFSLFCTFFYIGLFTIGGGLVAITLMQQTIVDAGIISQDTFYNMIAISESTPGPLGVNMATYIGYNLFGVSGAIITTLGEVLPSIICIIIIAKFLSAFHEKPAVKTVLTVLRPSSTGIILVAGVNVFLTALVNVPERFADIEFLKLFNWTNVLAYLVFVALLFGTEKLKVTDRKTGKEKSLKIHPIVVVLLGAVFGCFAN